MMSEVGYNKLLINGSSLDGISGHSCLQPGSIYICDLRLGSYSCEYLAENRVNLVRH